MEIHHTKHHQGYVNNLNNAIKGTSLEGISCACGVCGRLGELPENKITAVRNNGGGHVNHTLFWASMSPNAPIDQNPVSMTPATAPMVFTA